MLYAQIGVPGGQKMAKMVPKIVKRAGTLKRHLRVIVFSAVADIYQTLIHWFNATLTDF